MIGCQTLELCFIIHSTAVLDVKRAPAHQHLASRAKGNAEAWEWQVSRPQIQQAEDNPLKPTSNNIFQSPSPGLARFLNINVWMIMRLCSFFFSHFILCWQHLSKSLLGEYLLLLKVVRHEQECIPSIQN